MVRAISRTHEMLRRVGDEAWLTTPDGVITYPDLDTVRQLPIYDVVESDGRLYALSSRGIEVRDVDAATFRVLVPNEWALGIAVVGDTVFALQTLETTTIEPEAQLVMTAFDRFGSPYFVRRLVADSIISRGFRVRSMSVIQRQLVVNCSRKLVVSGDAAVTWREIDVNGEFLTAIDIGGEYPVAWLRSSNSSQGPALMISLDRWVMQPVELRTVAP